MARLKPIRIAENDRKEYARLVRNSKAKIARTKKNYGIDLSDKIVLPPIETFTDRKSFNEWKEKAGSFTNRANLNFQFMKNAYDVVASKKEINAIERDTKRAQRIADKLADEAKNKPFISGGKVQGTIGQQMLQMGKPNTAGVTRPPDFNFDKIRSKDQLKKKKENMEKRADPDFVDKRMEKMKESFIGILLDAFNSDADSLAERIKKMPTSDFYEMYLINEEFNFNEYYSIDGMDNDSELNDLRAMESVVELYERGEMNLDLKDFPNR